MKKREILITVGLMLLLCTTLTAAKKNRKTEKQKETVTRLELPLEALMAGRRLEKELEFSRKGQPYFTFDLVKGEIDLKSRSILLRRWTLQRHELYGDPVPLEPLELLSKKTRTPPRRDKIKPGEPPAPALTASGRFQITNYEIDDMPSRYSLIFRGHIEVHVGIEETGGFWKKTGHFFTRLSREATLPLRTINSRINRHNFTRLDWVMTSPQEAQSLFWACDEKMPWLFVFPATRK